MESANFSARFKTKSDLYAFMADYLHLHLPKPNSCRLDYLHMILNEKKRAIKRSNVGRWSIPSWPELTMTHLHQLVAQIPFIGKYFPDDFDPTHPRADREFFWGVVSFACPNFITSAITQAREKRQERNALRKQIRQDGGQVPISDGWLALLKSVSFKSRHRGKSRGALSQRRRTDAGSQIEEPLEDAEMQQRGARSRSAKQEPCPIELDMQQVVLPEDIDRLKTGYFRPSGLARPQSDEEEDDPGQVTEEDCEANPLEVSAYWGHYYRQQQEKLQHQQQAEALLAQQNELNRQREPPLFGNFQRQLHPQQPSLPLLGQQENLQPQLPLAQFVFHGQQPGSQIAQNAEVSWPEGETALVAQGQQPGAEGQLQVAGSAEGGEIQTEVAQEALVEPPTAVAQDAEQEPGAQHQVGSPENMPAGEPPKKRIGTRKRKLEQLQSQQPLGGEQQSYNADQPPAVRKKYNTFNILGL